MPNLHEGLIHEAAALFRLVDSVAKFIAEHRNTYSYTDATNRFLDRITDRAERTKDRVSNLVLVSPKSPEERQQLYAEIAVEKNLWRILHTYVKPASDAHILQLPAPLLDLASRQLRSINGLEDIELVALLTPELMYFQNFPRDNDLKKFVFVELPYSQGPSFFNNLAIYHELGHYAFLPIRRLQL
jgi:hypothetical protein